MSPFKNPFKLRTLATALGTALGTSLIPVCLISIGHAATFTYSNTAATTTQWNSGTSWNSTPVSATDTTLVFNATQAAGINTVSNNNIAGNFLLNSLSFTNVGPASGTAPTLLISGNALEFVSNGATTPTLSINPTGTVRPALTISNNLVLTNNLALSNGSASNPATLSGIISGSGNLTKSGAGTVTISNTANNFSGTVAVSNGILSVSSIGTSGSNSNLGTNSSITLGGGSNAGQLTWTGSSETTNKVFTMGGSTGGATISASNSGQTLTITQDLVGGTSTSARTLTLTGNGNINFSGAVSNGSGTVGVTKSGAGTLTLSGSNSQSGATTLNAGLLNINHANALGSGTFTIGGNGSFDNTNGGVSIANAFLLIGGSPTFVGSNAMTIGGATTLSGANRTITVTASTLTLGGAVGDLGEGRSLTKAGAGTLVLSNTGGSFSGGVNVTAGTLSVANLGNSGFNSSIGTNSAINLGSSSTSGTLRLLGTSDEITDKTINMAGTSGGATITVQGGAVTTFSSALGVTGTGNKTLTFASSGAASGIGITFNGLIADGTGSVVSLRANGSGSGTFVLGNTANSFSGTVTVDGNIVAKTTTIQVASIGNGGSVSSLGTNATVNLGSATAGSVNLLKYTGSGEVSNKVINLAGTLGTAGIDQSGASGLLKFTSNLTATGSGAKTLILQGSTAGQGEINGRIVDSAGGATSLSKQGSGTWTLSGSNSYTGTTNVSAGRLVINGSTSSTSLVTIDAGATLSGTGTVGGATTISGIHAPGNSPGTQTFSSNLGYATGASVQWELNGNTTAQGSPTAVFDQMLVGGNLNFAGLTTLDLSFVASGSAINWNNTFWDVSHANTSGWLLFDVTGTTSNFSNFSLTTTNWQDASGNLFNTIRSGSSFGLEQVGNDVYLTYTAVPESAAALLGGLGSLLLLRRRRA